MTRRPSDGLLTPPDTGLPIPETDRGASHGDAVGGRGKTVHGTERLDASWPREVHERNRRQIERVVADVVEELRRAPRVAVLVLRGGRVVGVVFVEASEHSCEHLPEISRARRADADALMPVWPRRGRPGELCFVRGQYALRMDDVEGVWGFHQGKWLAAAREELGECGA